MIDVCKRCPAPGTLALVLILLAGCGSGENFQPMSGQVTVNGKPLGKGVITFFPIGAGTTVGGEIVEGKFALARESGATPGHYRVEIIAFRPTGRTEYDIDQQANVDIEMQYLPPKYNVKSELVCDVEAKGKNEFSFDLEMK